MVTIPVRPRRALAGVAAVAAAAWLALTPSLAAAVDTAFTLSDSRLTTLGAFTTDATGGHYWAANAKSGTVYAINPDGSVAGTVKTVSSVTDIEAATWDNSTLYLGDIGDAAGSRTEIQVYGVSSPVAGKTATVKTYRFTYPDGAHDARGLLINGSGRFLVVTADGGVYEGPTTTLTGSRNKLTRLADVPGDIDDAAYLADGSVALRSATTLYTVDPTSWATRTQTAIDGQAQGGSVTMAIGGNSVLLAPRESGAVASVPIPTPVAPATASGTPSATPTDQSTEAPDPVATQKTAEEAAAVRDQSGTVLAIVAAGVLALAGAIFVLFKK